MTSLPGVYRMYGKDGELLYVGKAKNLKNRVSSYFVKTLDHPKTQALVARIYDIQTLVVRSETEALLLEQNLIKLHHPPYNIMLRDDKSYVYIFVSADKPYPRLASGRGKGKHQVGKFFGPYPSAYTARDTLVVLQKLFNVRSCENSFLPTGPGHVCNTRSNAALRPVSDLFLRKTIRQMSITRSDFCRAIPRS